MTRHENEGSAIRAEDAKGKFTEALNRASKDKERVVVTRRGRPVAAVVPMRDVRALERLEDRLDLADARAALAEWRREGGKSVPLEKVLKKYGIER